MAEMQFEDDLRAMFAAAPPAPDAAAFAARVDRRIDGRRRLRLSLVSLLGVTGLLISLKLLGLSLADFHLAMPTAQTALASVGDIGVWTAGIVLVTLAAALFQLLAPSET